MTSKKVALVGGILLLGYWCHPALSEDKRQPIKYPSNFFHSPANLHQDWPMNKPLEVSSLKEPVSLQDVPDFTGHKKFVMGNAHTDDMGDSWYMMFRVKESKDQVMEWYQNVLRMNKWNVTCASGVAVTANKSGSTFQLLVQPLRSNHEWPTQIEITYFLNKHR